jgi:hypothetical protein
MLLNVFITCALSWFYKRVLNKMHGIISKLIHSQSSVFTVVAVDFLQTKLTVLELRILVEKGSI